MSGMLLRQLVLEGSYFEAGSHIWYHMSATLTAAAILRWVFFCLFLGEAAEMRIVSPWYLHL